MHVGPEQKSLPLRQYVPNHHFDPRIF